MYIAALNYYLSNSNIARKVNKFKPQTIYLCFYKDMDFDHFTADLAADYT